MRSTSCWSLVVLISQHSPESVQVASNSSTPGLPDDTTLKPKPSHREPRLACPSCESVNAEPVARTQTLGPDEAHRVMASSSDQCPLISDYLHQYLYLSVYIYIMFLSRSRSRCSLSSDEYMLRCCGVARFSAPSSIGSNLGAETITNAILGVPYYKYSIHSLVCPNTYSDYKGPDSIHRRGIKGQGRGRKI